VTVGDRIRKCLRGPISSDVLRDVGDIARMLRTKGLDYEGTMMVVVQANKGTVDHPRDVWEERLHAADRWESLQ